MTIASTRSSEDEPIDAADAVTNLLPCMVCGAGVHPDARTCPRCHHVPSAEARVSRPVDGMAVAALALSCLWIGWLGSIAGILLGHATLRRMERDGGDARWGAPLANGAIALGWAALAAFALLLLYLGLRLAFEYLL